jgi:hypothetical protein
MILSTHGVIASQIQSFVGLLDTYPNAAAAYSLRKLRAAYTGNAIRVRRSSDNTEQDIEFTALGNLDTSSLTSFCGSGNGFVTTWYDQSGNAYNATESTAANQPQIVSSGSILNINSKPALSFDATNDRLTIVNSASNLKFLHSDLSTIITVNQMNSTTAKSLMGSNAGTGSKIGFYLESFTKLSHAISNGGTNITINDTTTNITANTQYLNFILGNPASSTLNQRSLIYINNSSVNQNNTNSGTLSTSNSSHDVQLGTYGNNSSNMNGYYQEVIFYPSSQSSNRTGIQSNINTYYAIY